MQINPKALLATAFLAGLLGFGGVSLASAQESTTTTEPTQETTPDSTHDTGDADRAKCDHGDGSADADTGSDAGTGAAL